MTETYYKGLPFLLPSTTYFLHNQLNNCEQKKYERLKQNGLSPELYVQDLAIDFPEPAVVVSREPLGLELVAERLVERSTII